MPVFAAVRWSGGLQTGCKKPGNGMQTGCKAILPAGRLPSLDRHSELSCALGGATLHLDEQRYGRRILGVGHDQNLVAEHLAMCVQAARCLTIVVASPMIDSPGLYGSNRTVSSATATM